MGLEMGFGGLGEEIERWGLGMKRRRGGRERGERGERRKETFF